MALPVSGKAIGNILKVVTSEIGKKDPREVVKEVFEKYPARRKKEEHEERGADTVASPTVTTPSFSLPSFLSGGKTATAPPPLSTVTDKETLLYQVEHLLAEAAVLEVHLSEGCIIAGKPCDCCKKHSSKMSRFAQETIPIAARQGQDIGLYNEMLQWASSIEAIPIGTMKQYQQESGGASKFRKRLEALKEQLKKEIANGV